MDSKDFQLLIDAVLFGSEAHNGQFRKYTDNKVPYFNHPLGVARIISAAGFRAEMIAAALLHDVVEDTEVTADQIREKFGDEVARLVLEVTDVSKPTDGNRQARKAIDRAHLAQGSAEGQTIKCADMIVNTADIVKNDPKFAKVYLVEIAETLKVLDKADPGMKARAWAQVNKGQEYLLAQKLAGH